MSFLDEVKDSTPPRYKCGVAEWLTTQPDIDDVELRAAVGATTVAAVWRAMKNRGYVKQAQTLERHVGGVCSCRS